MTPATGRRHRHALLNALIFTIKFRQSRSRSTIGATLYTENQIFAMTSHRQGIVSAIKEAVMEGE